MEIEQIETILMEVKISESFFSHILTQSFQSALLVSLPPPDLHVHVGLPQDFVLGFFFLLSFSIFIPDVISPVTLNITNTLMAVKCNLPNQSFPLKTDS